MGGGLIQYGHQVAFFCTTFNPLLETCTMTTAQIAARTSSFPRTGGGWV
jgi:hypothetical protein